MAVWMQWIDPFLIGLVIALLFLIPKGILWMHKWNTGASYEYLRWGACFLSSGLFLVMYLLGTSIISYAKILMR